MILTPPFPAGSIVFQPFSFSDGPFSWLLALRTHRFTHCGIATDGGKMVTATLGSGVTVQDSGASGSVATDVVLPSSAVSWANLVVGRCSYDWVALLLIALGIRDTYLTSPPTFTCSSIVAFAASQFAASLGVTFERTITPDDLASRLLK